jgi:hypothetical protein
VLCATLNIPQPPTRFSICNNTVSSAVVEVDESYMMQARREAVAVDDEDDSVYNWLFCWKLAKTWTPFPEWHYISYLF